MINSILEKSGSFLQKKQKYLLFFSIFLFSTFLNITFFKYQDYQEKKYRFEKISEKALKTLEQRKKFRNFILEKEKFDPFYIDKNLETSTFLKSEISSLTHLQNSIVFSNNENIKERLDLLTKKNNLKFIENNIIQSKNLKEVEEEGSKIELNENDLISLLSLIEDIKIENSPTASNKPQLIITKFELEKKEHNHFLLNLNLFKREFIKKKVPNE